MRTDGSWNCRAVLEGLLCLSHLKRRQCLQPHRSLLRDRRQGQRARPAACGRWIELLGDRVSHDYRFALSHHGLRKSRSCSGTEPLHSRFIRVLRGSTQLQERTPVPLGVQESPRRRCTDEGFLASVGVRCDSRASLFRMRRSESCLSWITVLRHRSYFGALLRRRCADDARTRGSQRSESHRRRVPLSDPLRCATAFLVSKNFSDG